MKFKISHRFEDGMAGVLPPSLKLEIVSTKEPLTMAFAAEITEIIRGELETIHGGKNLRERIEMLEKEIDRLRADHEQKASPYR